MTRSKHDGRDEWKGVDGGWVHTPCGTLIHRLARPFVHDDCPASLFTDRPAPDTPDTTTGRRHPETSHYAADRMLPRSGTQRARVLDSIRYHTEWGDGGLTDEEIGVELGMNPSSVRPRRQELQKMGWVEDSGDRRETESGMRAIVWRYIE